MSDFYGIVNFVGYFFRDSYIMQVFFLNENKKIELQIVALLELYEAK